MLSVGAGTIARPLVGAASTGLSATVSMAKVSSSVLGQSARTATAAVVKPAVTASLPGDLNQDGQLDPGDVIAMEMALVDPTTYANNHGLTYQQLVTLADANGDGKFTNADLQFLLQAIRNPPKPPPPPPPTQNAVPLIIPAGSNVAASVTPANSSTAPPASQGGVSRTAGVFTPLGSAEALLAGGGGDSQPSPPTVTNNGPPMPTRSTTSDIALVAFAPHQSSGGGDAVENMLMKIADVEEPQLLAIEYGDEVVKREVTVHKTVVPSVPAEQPVVAPLAEAPVLAPVVEKLTEFPWRSYVWLLAIPAGAGVAAAAWWMCRQRQQGSGNVGTLLRRLWY